MLTFSVAASAQNQTEPDLYIYEYKMAVDSAKADSIYNAYLAELRTKLIEAAARPYLNEIAIIDKLVDYEQSGAKIAEDDVWRYLVRLSKERRQDKDEKTISKRKVPKGFTNDVLLPRKKKLQAHIDGYNPWLPSWDQVFNEHMRKYEYPDPERGYDYVYMGEVYLPKKETPVPKPNPACRDNYFNGNFRLSDYEPWYTYENHHWDNAQQSQGWEWASWENGKDLQNKTVYFPEERSYRYHPSHPEYRISCNWRDNYCYHPNVYDEKGVLVRAGNIDGLGQGYEEITEAVMMAICKRDFLANKYDINSAKPETLLALRIKFDLADAVDARFKKYMKMAQDARDEIVAATTPAQYAAAKKKQSEALNVLMEYVVKEREPQAMNYIKQLKSDHQSELSYLYKIERVDNVTFKLYFLNDKIECGCIALMKWSNKEPYEAQYEFELLPCETITIRR